MISALLGAIGLASIAGCGPRLGSPTAASIPSGDYFPLRTGAQWIYSSRWSTERGQTWQPTNGATMSVQAVSPAADGGKTATVSVVRRENTSCPADIGGGCGGPGFVDEKVSEQWTSGGGSLVWGGMAIPAAGLRTAFDTLLTFAYPTPIGTITVAGATSSPVGVFTEARTPTQQTTSLVATPSTAVGDLADVVLLQQTFTLTDTQIPKNGAPQTSASTQPTSVWLERNIGVVKISRDVELNNQISTIMEFDLATYSIPPSPGG